MEQDKPKIIVQIPCFNEAATLPLVFATMPRELPGATLEFQIIDDGCTDNTAQIARNLGVHHIVIVPPPNRRWLGRAFSRGVHNALALGADILVNTDGDNQYPSELIPQLVEPILSGKADLVIGDRRPHNVSEFSFIKRALQYLGCKTIQAFVGHEVRDASSGFRAYSREALLRLNCTTNYTYTIETLMQAFEKGLAVHWIPIGRNPKTRESHLIPNIWGKVARSGCTILRLATVYHPFRSFLILSLPTLLIGVMLLLRFLYFYFRVPFEAAGHVQSVVIGGVLVTVSVQILALGVLGEVFSTNRLMVEELLTRFKER